MRDLRELAGRMRWGTRTFLTQALVVAASVITAALVALVVGPPLFHEHLLELGHSAGSAEMAHVEEAFVDAGAVQCGFCTPGLVVAVVDLLERVPRPSDDEIRESLSGNLCRCTGYAKIFDAVGLAAERA